jgi:bifunctional non-homologous end joining protein LigD
MSEQPKNQPTFFVVPKHQATTLHDDFRLESGGMMRTSAIPWSPTLAPRLKRLAMPRTDHAHPVSSLQRRPPKRAYTAPDR